MPHYDYECDCGHVQEEFHSMTKDPEIKCKKCEKKMRKLISGGAGAHFIGEGFYKTDYTDKGL